MGVCMEQVGFYSPMLTQFNVKPWRKSESLFWGCATKTWSPLLFFFFFSHQILIQWFSILLPVLSVSSMSKQEHSSTDKKTSRQIEFWCYLSNLLFQCRDLSIFLCICTVGNALSVLVWITQWGNKLIIVRCSFTKLMEIYKPVTKKM